MDSNLHHHHHHRPQQQQISSSGFTRYRSAPSSYFESFISSSGSSGGDFDQFLNGRSLSPETFRIFKRFMSSGGPDEDSDSQNLCGDIGQNSSANEAMQSQVSGPLKQETEALPPNNPLPPHHHQQQQQQQDSGYTSASQVMYQGQSQPSHDSTESNLGVNNSYGVVSSMAMDCSPQMKIGGGNRSNLIRHSSSPAGLFSHMDGQSGYGVMRAMGDFGGGKSTNAEASFSSASRLKGQMDFSSGHMASISEIGDKSMGDQENDGDYIRGFPVSSWDDLTILSDNFPRGVGDKDRNGFSGSNASEKQSGRGNRTLTVLSHHLSLPTSSAELSAMEKLLEFQDSAPCKLRAKRGYATHPRSIAERVRRTKISERMRKLQELVPNMDKQTNTADMLDLAVEYIKDLEKKVKTLSDMRSRCTCSSKQKP